LIAIGFVALLGCGTFYFSKKVGPKLAGSKGKNILVSDSISLGKNKTLHIVEIDNKKLLIGCTANSINTLTELSGSFQEILQTCQDDENES
jgi:flagellar biosynthetic protein FliO